MLGLVMTLVLEEIISKKKSNYFIFYNINFDIIAIVIKWNILTFSSTFQENPSDAKIKSHVLMIKSGMIKQETSEYIHGYLLALKF